MNIALLTPTFYGFSGIDRVVEQQAKELSEAGHQVTVFALKGDHELAYGQLELLYSPDRVTLERVYRLLYPLDAAAAIKMTFRLRAFDEVVSHHYPMNWLALLAKRVWGTRYVYYDHGIASAELFVRPVERAYMQLFHKLAGLTIRGADHIVSDSEYLRSEIQRQFGRDSEVRYCRIDMSRLVLPSLVENKVLKEAFRGGETIFAIGRVAPYKGLHLLVQAFKLVHEQKPDTTLLIAGDMSRFAEYSRELASGLDSAVRFLGYVTDEELAYCYAHCDVFATASLWEGFDLPAVEAQAFGKPTVAFDIGSHREIIQDGRTGILVQPRDIRAFANAITRALDMKEQMGDRATEWSRRFQ